MTRERYGRHIPDFETGSLRPGSLYEQSIRIGTLIDVAEAILGDCDDLQYPTHPASNVTMLLRMAQAEIDSLQERVSD